MEISRKTAYKAGDGLDESAFFESESVPCELGSIVVDTGDPSAAQGWIVDVELDDDGYCGERGREEACCFLSSSYCCSHL